MEEIGGMIACAVFLAMLWWLVQFFGCTGCI